MAVHVTNPPMTNGVMEVWPFTVTATLTLSLYELSVPDGSMSIDRRATVMAELAPMVMTAGNGFPATETAVQSPANRLLGPVLSDPQASRAKQINGSAIADTETFA